MGGGDREGAAGEGGGGGSQGVSQSLAPGTVASLARALACAPRSLACRSRSPTAKHWGEGRDCYRFKWSLGSLSSSSSSSHSLSPSLACYPSLPTLPSARPPHRFASSRREGLRAEVRGGRVEEWVGGPGAERLPLQGSFVVPRESVDFRILVRAKLLSPTLGWKPRVTNTHAHVLGTADLHLG